jgi:hypothetical protein
MHAVLTILAALLVATNAMATVIALRSETSTTSQRIFQSCAIWLLPVIGAFVVILFHRLDHRTQGLDGERATLDGSEIDVARGVGHDGHH